MGDFISNYHMWSWDVYRQTYRPPYKVPSKQAILSTTLVSNKKLLYSIFQIGNIMYTCHSSTENLLAMA